MDASIYIAVLLLAGLSAFTTLLGVWMATYTGRHDEWIAAGIGFSVGIMLLISVFELVPQALADAPLADVAIALGSGALLIGILHYLIPHAHLFEEQGVIATRLARTAYLTALGLILHDFPEGFAMANAYITAPGVGVTVAVAIALHNIPEEFAMAVPIVGVHRRSFLFRAALVSALAEPAGACIGLLAAHLQRGWVPLFTAFAAGAMMFVAVHELVPMARAYGRLHLFGLGMLSSVIIYIVLALLVPG